MLSDFKLDDDGSKRDGHWLGVAGPAILVLVDKDLVIREAENVVTESTKLIVSSIETLKLQPFTKFADHFSAVCFLS